MRGKSEHIVGAAIGLAAAGALWYLLTRSAQGFNHIAVFDMPDPFDSSKRLSTDGSVVAAAALVGAAVIAGLLAGSPWLSPVAALVAGLALTGYGLLWSFANPQSLLTMTNPFPGLATLEADELLRSGMFQVLGGALLTSAALPWRWTRPRAPQARREPLGPAIGLAGVPALWYLIQLANPVGYNYVVFSAHLPQNTYLWLVPQLALAIVLGMLMAARPIPPVTAAIAGVPLLAAGLGLALAPVGTSQFVAHLILRFANEGFAAVWASGLLGQSVLLGAYLMFGGMLVVSAALPWRWRKPVPVPGADQGPAADVVPEATAS